MTTNYHTAISVGAAANAATFNTPLGALDEAITNAQSGIYSALEYGAVGDGSTDDTVALNAAITALSAYGILNGHGKEYVVTTLNLKSNMTMQNFRFKTKAGSTDLVSPITIGANSDTATRENIILRDIIINGNRQNQTSIGASEDGGRHGFRIIGHVDNLLIENCEATYCASDGIEFYSGISTRAVDEDANTAIQTNIVVRNCKFNWNRRHGGSGDTVDTILFDNCQFNDNGQDLNAIDDLDHGNRGANVAGTKYGNGFDMEGYDIGSAFQNVIFSKCVALRNVRNGIIFYDPTDQETAGYAAHDNIIINNCYLDLGTDTDDNAGITFSPLPSNEAKGDAFTNVILADNSISGAVILRCVDQAYIGGGVIDSTIAYTGGLYYVDNVFIGAFANPDDKSWDTSNATYKTTALSPIQQADVTGLTTTSTPQFAGLGIGSPAVSGVGAYFYKSSGESEIIRAGIAAESPLAVTLGTGGNRPLSFVDGNGPTTRMTIELGTGNVGIGSTSPAAQLHLDQSSSTGAKPVLTVDQADVSEELIRFIGTSTTDASQSLVDAADMENPGSIVGWLKIYVQDDQATNGIADGAYYIPFYSAPTHSA